MTNLLKHLFFFFPAPYGMQDLSSPTRGQIQDPCIGSTGVLTTGLPGKSLKISFLNDWHDRLKGHEFEPTTGDGKGQGSLECCSPWGRKESDMAEQLNTTTQKLNEN